VAISTQPFTRRNGSNPSFNRSRAGKSDSTSRSGSRSSSDVNGTSYSSASQRRTSSSDWAGVWSGPLEAFASARARASTAVSCLAAIIFSSRSPRTGGAFSVAFIDHTPFCLKSTGTGESVDQTHRERDRFLFQIQDFLELLLGLLERSFLLLARLAVFGDRRFKFGGGSVGVDGLSAGRLLPRWVQHQTVDRPERQGRYRHLEVGGPSCACRRHRPRRLRVGPPTHH
jgi:hypothetical protein